MYYLKPLHYLFSFFFFFFNDTATTEIYTLSLHDALPISAAHRSAVTDAGEPSTPTAIRPPANSGMASPRLQNHRSVSVAFRCAVVSQWRPSGFPGRSWLACRPFQPRAAGVTRLPAEPRPARLAVTYRIGAGERPP